MESPEAAEYRMLDEGTLLMDPQKVEGYEPPFLRFGSLAVAHAQQQQQQRRAEAHAAEPAQPAPEPPRTATPTNIEQPASELPAAVPSAGAAAAEPLSAAELNARLVSLVAQEDAEVARIRFEFAAKRAALLA